MKNTHQIFIQNAEFTVTATEIWTLFIHSGFAYFCTTNSIIVLHMFLYLMFHIQGGMIPSTLTPLHVEDVGLVILQRIY